jgi:hypothetical protein
MPLSRYKINNRITALSNKNHNIIRIQHHRKTICTLNKVIAGTNLLFITNYSIAITNNYITTPEINVGLLFKIKYFKMQTDNTNLYRIIHIFGIILFNRVI